MTPDDWEARIEDLEFGLLEPDEAREVREAIARDPDLAAIQRRVVRRHELLKQGARVSAPPIRWPRLPAPPASRAPAEPTRYSWKNLAIALSLLLAVTVGERVWYIARAPQADSSLASLEVISPTVHAFGNDLPVAVIARQKPKNAPSATTFEWAMRSDSPRSGSASTNSQGFASLLLPAQASDTFVSFRLPGQKKEVQIEPKPRGLAPVGRLVTDRGVYQPGEEIRWRGVLLNRSNLAPAPTSEARFVIRDPNQAEVAHEENRPVDQGVVDGSWPLPANASEGLYRLELQTSSHSKASDIHPVTVERFIPPGLRMKIDLPPRSFRAGENVDAQVLLQWNDGTPARGQSLIGRLVQGSTVLAESSNATNEEGRATSTLILPASLTRERVAFEAEVIADGRSHRARRTVPILSDQVDLAFFPESGGLVAGISQRIYFQARDVNDQPVAIKGRIIDERGDGVGTFQASASGRGVFEMKPRSDGRYSIEVEQPPGLLPIRPFPAPSSQDLALRAGAAAFGPDQPIELSLSSPQSGSIHYVVATCREQVVGLAAAVAGETVTIPLSSTAFGVIRLTAYRPTDLANQPVAERLVYRHRAERADLSAHLSGPASDSVLIEARDEAGQPIPGALLGVRLVDVRAADLEPTDRLGQEAHFTILSEIQRPEELDRAEIALDRTPAAEHELDLVLATHGWRTFAPAPDGIPSADLAEPLLRRTVLVPDPKEQQRNLQTFEQRHARYLRLLSVAWAGTIVAAVTGFLLHLGRVGTSVRIAAVATILVVGGFFAVFLTLDRVPMAPDGLKRAGAQKPAPVAPSPVSPTPSASARKESAAADRAVVAPPAEPNGIEDLQENRVTPSNLEQKRFALGARAKQHEQPALNAPSILLHEEGELKGKIPSPESLDQSTPASPSPAPESAASDAPPGGARAALPEEEATPTAQPVERVFAPVDLDAQDRLSLRLATIVWAPNERTDERGTTVIRLPAPMAEGRYRLIIDAHTLDGRLGSLKQEWTLPAR